MQPRTALAPFALTSALLGCSAETTTANSSETSAATESSTGETSEDTSATETGVDEDLCGNGTLDPGEACEPTGQLCDTCTSDCREEPLPANEWVVELEHIDPQAYIDYDEHWHILATGPASLLAVRGRTREGAEWLYTFTLTGEQAAMLGPSEHGFDVILDHALGTAGDLALLGLVGETSHVRHMLADGTLEAPIEVSPAPDQVAITSHGFIHLAAGGSAHAISFAGELQWMRPGPYEMLGNIDDRVVLHSLDDFVEFVAGDGSDALVWDWGAYPLPDYSRLASTSAFMLAGHSVSDKAFVEVLDLWTGQTMETLLVTGVGGREWATNATALDARADGWPLLAWSAYLDLVSLFDGSEPSRGVGGPGELEAVVLHRCDLLRSTRIGSDGGVFVVARQLDGGVALARRTTLR